LALERQKSPVAVVVAPVAVEQIQEDLESYPYIAGKLTQRGACGKMVWKENMR
jgi:hypothetical protein